MTTKSELPLVVFLTSGASARNDNFERIPAAFADAGWHVALRPHDSLSVGTNGLSAGDVALQGASLVWPIGFGDRSTFFDRAQLLGWLPQDKLITGIDAWLTMHGKAVLLEYCPPTAVAAHAEPLLNLMDTHEGDWVLKPCAGSFGRDVHFVTANPSGRDLVAAVVGAADEFYLLQRYVSSIVTGETRTLVADGRILGSYLRVPSQDIRANVSLGAHVGRCELTANDATLVGAIAKRLLRSGVGFASIDTVDGYLIEINIANPGGLATMTDLYDHDYAADLARIVTATRA